MGEKAEAFPDGLAFLRIPKVLFEKERFRSISTSAKLLYGMLLDRISLSSTNSEKWKDKNKRLYVYCTVESISKMFGCSDKKAMKLLAELEVNGLIERKRQGQGKPAMILVKRITEEEEDIGSN